MTDPPVDRELIERYVLGRATPEERGRLDGLVEKNPAWREALRRELAFVEGIRREGRDRMKERLQTRLAESSRSSTPWTRILTAAAVVVVVAGIAVLNRWLPSGGEDGPAVVMNEEAVRPAEAERNEYPPPEAPSPTGMGRLDAGRARGSDRRRGDDLLHSAPPPAAGQKEAFAASEAPRIEVREKDRSDDGERTPLAWATGTELSGPDRAEPAAAARKTADRSAMEAKVREESARPATLEGDRQEIRISQAPPGVAGRFRDQKVERLQFPVSFMQTGDILEVTLYLDTPLDTSTLKQASISSVSPDSLVIQAGRRTFGVRIPDAVTQVRQQLRLEQETGRR